MMAILRFAKTSRGSMSAEAALILPVLFWAYLGTLAFFDAFRQQNVAMKASYSVADMISRETEALTADDIEGLNDVFDYLTNSNHPSWIRVTSIRWDENDARFEVNWSHATKDRDALTTETLQDLDSLIPAMALGDSVVLLETAMIYEPIFQVGLDANWTSNFVVTRPRFASQVVFDPTS